MLLKRSTINKSNNQEGKETNTTVSCTIEEK